LDASVLNGEAAKSPKNNSNDSRQKSKLEDVVSG